jgi:twinkle protein
VIFSPEMPVVPHLRDKLMRIFGGVNADQAIDDAFAFISQDPTGKNDDDEFDLALILDKATDAVMRDGVRVLLIDRTGFGS